MSVNPNSPIRKSSQGTDSSPGSIPIKEGVDYHAFPSPCSSPTRCSHSGKSRQEIVVDKVFYGVICAKLNADGSKSLYQPKSDALNAIRLKYFPNLIYPKDTKKSLESVIVHMNDDFETLPDSIRLSQVISKGLPPNLLETKKLGEQIIFYERENKQLFKVMLQVISQEEMNLLKNPGSSRPSSASAAAIMPAESSPRSDDSSPRSAGGHKRIEELKGSLKGRLSRGRRNSTSALSSSVGSPRYRGTFSTDRTNNALPLNEDILRKLQADYPQLGYTLEGERVNPTITFDGEVPFFVLQADCLKYGVPKTYFENSLLSGTLNLQIAGMQIELMWA